MPSSQITGANAEGADARQAAPSSEASPAVSHALAVPEPGKWQSLTVATVVLIGLALRLAGNRFGWPGSYRPDEEHFVRAALSILGGDLNPHSFLYPSLSFYVLALVFLSFRSVGGLLGMPIGDLPAYFAATEFAVARWIGRCVVGIVGALGILAVYRLGARLGGPRVGLLAAFLLATNFIHIRDSHFLTSDVPLALGCTLVLASLVALASGTRRSDYVRAGLLWGVALATKYTAVALAPSFVVAHLLRSRSPVGGHGLADLLLGTAVALGCFFVLSPYVALDAKTAIEHIGIVRYFAASGLPGFAESHGWRWVILFGLGSALGNALLILFVTSLVWVVWHTARRSLPVRRAMIVAVFPVGLVAIYVPSHWVPIRYMVPIAPAACVLGALLLERIATALCGPQRSLVVAWGLALVVSAGPLARAVRLDTLLTQKDTRQLTREWIVDHVPPGPIGVRGHRFGKPQLPLTYELVDVDPVDGRSVESSVEWFLVDRYPLPEYSPDPDPVFDDFLRRQTDLVFAIDPFREPDDGLARFDVSDAFYVPVSGFSAVTRPGPRLYVYRRRASKHS